MKSCMPRCYLPTPTLFLEGSVKSYLVPALTELRKGRDEAIQAVSVKNGLRSRFPALTGLMSLYFSFLFLAPAWPQRPSLTDGGRLSHLLLSLIGLVPCGLMDSGLMLVLSSRRWATIQGHACYSLINKDSWKTGRNKAL